MIIAGYAFVEYFPKPQLWKIVSNGNVNAKTYKTYSIFLKANTNISEKRTISPVFASSPL